MDHRWMEQGEHKGDIGGARVEYRCGSISNG